MRARQPRPRAVCGVCAALRLRGPTCARGAHLALDAVDEDHLRGTHAVPGLLDRRDGEGEDVLVAGVEVVQREVVGAGDDAELVLLPVVVGNHQAVGVAEAFVEDGECNVDGLADDEALHRLHLFVQQQHTAALLFLLLVGHGTAEAEQARDEQSAAHDVSDLD